MAMNDFDSTPGGLSEMINDVLACTPGKALAFFNST
jgi:hypothetical protein